MKFKIGQTFAGTYPPEAASWCNSNGAHIRKNSSGAYEILENPKPTIEDLQYIKRLERNNLLDTSDWRVSRCRDQNDLLKEYKSLGPEHVGAGEEDDFEPIDSIFLLITYREFLRNFTKHSNWWEKEIPTYEDWLIESGHAGGVE